MTGYRLRKIGVWSAVKISFLINALLGACLGFLVGMFLFLFGALFSGLSDLAGAEEFPIPIFGGIAALFFLPIFYGFLMAVMNGIIITAIGVWLYNIFARLVGGVEVELEQAPVRAVYSAPPPAMPQQPVSPPPNFPKPDPTPPIFWDDEQYKPPKSSEGGVDV